jgi:hypothetical protein
MTYPRRREHHTSLVRGARQNLAIDLAERNELLGMALDLWEAEDGPFSTDDINTAYARLCLDQPVLDWTTDPLTYECHTMRRAINRVFQTAKERAAQCAPRPVPRPR